jgi:FtsP/CotA-like multicopper oxidase with cupredoxin domain
MTTSETSEVSMHVHLVRFDELGSDGTSVGWNYVQAAMPGQTYSYRWFVDQPLRTVFFHDHQYANLHQQKGLFAAMNVEPADATWTDPATGAPTDGTGPMADIHSASGPHFREFTLFYSDRVPMWRNGGSGAAVNPPDQVGDYGEDQGGYAINYRNEPLQTRTRPGAPGLAGDPAYVYSSAVHGDPSTPLLRAYSGDPVVIRQVTGAHEEVHNFTLHGHRCGLNAANGGPALVVNGAGEPGDYLAARRNGRHAGDPGGRHHGGLQLRPDPGARPDQDDDVVPADRHRQRVHPAGGLR